MKTLGSRLSYLHRDEMTVQQRAGEGGTKTGNERPGCCPNTSWHKIHYNVLWSINKTLRSERRKLMEVITHNSSRTAKVRASPPTLPAPTVQRHMKQMFFRGNRIVCSGPGIAQVKLGNQGRAIGRVTSVKFHTVWISQLFLINKMDYREPKWAGT